MVKAAVTASDPADGFTRYWILTVDNPPVAGWDTNTNPDTEVHKSGDTMMKDISMTDGDHLVYFMVSQSGGPGYGTYAGTIQLDGGSAPFSGVKMGTPAIVKVTVKNGVVITEQATSGPGGAKTSFNWNSIKAKLQSRNAKIVVGVIGVAIVSLLIYVGIKKKKSRF